MLSIYHELSRIGISFRILIVLLSPGGYGVCHDAGFAFGADELHSDDVRLDDNKIEVSLN